jgi:hypothetical protein
MTVQVRVIFALLDQTPIGLGRKKVEWQMQDIQATCCAEALDIRDDSWIPAWLEHQDRPR